jgi:hypothetical protein
MICKHCREQEHQQCATINGNYSWCDCQHLEGGNMPEREAHYVQYSTVENRHYWECQTCGRGGSVGEFGDPELAAERSHGFPVGTIRRGEGRNL